MTNGMETPLCDPSLEERLIMAFVEGAKWWEYRKEGATMWQSDQGLALIAAECRLAAGVLGCDPTKNAIQSPTDSH